MGDITEPEILELFWRKEFNPVLKEAKYLILLYTACKKAPFFFYGEMLGVGGTQARIAFSIHQLKRVADFLRINYNKKTATKVYEEFVKRKYVHAVRDRHRMLYTITDEGVKACQETLENLQKINHVRAVIQDRFNSRVLSIGIDGGISFERAKEIFNSNMEEFMREPEEYNKLLNFWNQYWKRISEIWGNGDTSFLQKLKLRDVLSWKIRIHPLSKMPSEILEIVKDLGEMLILKEPEKCPNCDAPKSEIFYDSKEDRYVCSRCGQKMILFKREEE